MKLKRLPEDFQVEERTGLQPGSAGPFALYRLTKEDLGTIEAVEAVLERFRLPRARASYGGLKDRHARTAQFITIFRGPRRGFQLAHLHLEYLGQTMRPFTPAEISGNRFQVVVRSLSQADLKTVASRLETVTRDGFPNYFDDQRFGSVGDSNEFVARPWIAGNFERALWLALADPRLGDRAQEKKDKALLREHWGDWPACKKALGPSHRRSIVTFLCDHPKEFRRAFALVRQDLRSLYLAAFQSGLWNRTLADLLRQTCPVGSLVEVPSRLGPLPFFTALDETARAVLRNTSLPLPSARLKRCDLFDKTLAAEGLALREIRVKYPRDSFFSKGTRPSLLVPTDLRHEEADDELDPGRRKLILRFDLARGAYATTLIKSLSR